MKILVAQINSIIGDISSNQKKILASIEYAKERGCTLLITPELALVGYPPEDILHLSGFVEKAEQALEKIIQASTKISVIVGTIRRNLEKGEKHLFNTAAICYDGKLIGFQDKTLLPTYDVFDERRYFEPAAGSKYWQLGEHKIGITICEDIWQHSKAVPVSNYEQDPIACLAKEKLDVLVNLSASPFYLGKLSARIEVCKKAAQTLHCPVVLCNQVGGNDSLIFDGQSLMISDTGDLTSIGKSFSEDLFTIDTELKTPLKIKENSMKDLHHALLLGLKDYFSKLGFQKACIGLSGGIDSALVACLAVQALGKENVVGVAMPSRYSSEESIVDAKDLAKRLGIAFEIIPIENPFVSFLELLTPHFNGKEADMTEENLQARIRGMILMALSNKHGCIVLSTGNKSELALGYSTLYGDMCGGLAVISDLTKGQVYALSHYINSMEDLIPKSTLTKAPSAELKPNQKDSDTLPDYPLIDQVLRDYIEFGQSPEEIIRINKFPPSIVHDLIKRIHANEYKRRQSPPGLKISEKSFSVGRRFPIVQGWV